MRLYPKASAPASEATLDAANARAERWRQRHSEALRRIAEVRTLANGMANLANDPELHLAARTVCDHYARRLHAALGDES